MDRVTELSNTNGIDCKKWNLVVLSIIWVNWMEKAQSRPNYCTVGVVVR